MIDVCEWGCAVADSKIVLALFRGVFVQWFDVN